MKMWLVASAVSLMLFIASSFFCWMGFFSSSVPVTPLAQDSQKLWKIGARIAGTFCSLTAFISFFIGVYLPEGAYFASLVMMLAFSAGFTYYASWRIYLKNNPDNPENAPSRRARSVSTLFRALCSVAILAGLLWIWIAGSFSEEPVRAAGGHSALMAFGILGVFSVVLFAVVEIFAGKLPRAEAPSVFKGAIIDFGFAMGAAGALFTAALNYAAIASSSDSGAFKVDSEVWLFSIFAAFISAWAVLLVMKTLAYVKR